MRSSLFSLSTLLIVVMLGVGIQAQDDGSTEEPVPTTPAPETPVPTTPVPETPVPTTPPETPVPQTPAPETPVPMTPAPETPVPMTPVPETPTPPTPMPETQPSTASPPVTELEETPQPTPLPDRVDTTSYPTMAPGECIPIHATVEVLPFPNTNAFRVTLSTNYTVMIRIDTDDASGHSFQVGTITATPGFTGVLPLLLPRRPGNWTVSSVQCPSMVLATGRTPCPTPVYSMSLEYTGTECAANGPCYFRDRSVVSVGSTAVGIAARQQLRMVVHVNSSVPYPVHKLYTTTHFSFDVNAVLSVALPIPYSLLTCTGVADLLGIACSNSSTAQPSAVNTAVCASQVPCRDWHTEWIEYTLGSDAVAVNRIRAEIKALRAAVVEAVKDIEALAFCNASFSASTPQAIAVNVTRSTPDWSDATLDTSTACPSGATQPCGNNAIYCCDVFGDDATIVYDATDDEMRSVVAPQGLYAFSNVSQGSRRVGMSFTAHGAVNATNTAVVSADALLLSANVTKSVAPPSVVATVPVVYGQTTAMLLVFGNRVGLCQLKTVVLLAPCGLGPNATVQSFNTTTLRVNLTSALVDSFVEVCIPSNTICATATGDVVPANAGEVMRLASSVPFVASTPVPPPPPGSTPDPLFVSPAPGGLTPTPPTPLPITAVPRNPGDDTPIPWNDNFTLTDVPSTYGDTESGLALEYWMIIVIIVGGLVVFGLCMFAAKRGKSRWAKAEVEKARARNDREFDARAKKFQRDLNMAELEQDD